MKKTNRENVSFFLNVFKQAASINGIYFVPRPSHIDALSKLNLTETNREEIILSLSVNDYCSGPSKDPAQNVDIWIFGKEINAKIIYIKLRFFEIDKKIQAKCLSFHEAEYPMTWPFKK